MNNQPDDDAEDTDNHVSRGTELSSNRFLATMIFIGAVLMLIALLYFAY